MYWIDVLGNLSTTACVFFGIAVSVLVVLFILFFAVLGSYSEEDQMPHIKYAAKRTAWVAISMLPLMIFVPSTESLYVIYGVGGTIDYLKSNDTAKQLPDKAIVALDK